MSTKTSALTRWRVISTSRRNVGDQGDTAKGRGGQWFVGAGDMEVSSADPKIWEGGTGPVAGVLWCEYGRIPAQCPPGLLSLP